jgi:MFS family permease
MTTQRESAALPERLLLNRNFLLLWSAYVVSAMGDHLSEMAILKTQNALGDDVDITPLAARLSFAFFLPFLLFAPLTGLLADRWPRRLVMFIADAARCVIMLFFALLIGFTQDWGVWGPFVPVFLVGVFAAPFSPSRTALLPTLLRDNQIVRANGLISGVGFISTMVATVLSGYLAEHYHPNVSFHLDAATYGLSALCVLMIRPPRQAAVRLRSDASVRNTVRQMIDGYRYAGQHRSVWELLLIGGLIWFAASTVNSVIPALVRDVYHGEYIEFSLFRGFVAVGLILGAGGIALISDTLRSEVATTWGLLAGGAGVALVALSAALPLVPGVPSAVLPFVSDQLAVVGAVGLIIAGAGASVIMASYNALLQKIVPNRIRGRVFGAKDLITTFTLLLATGFLGVPRWGNLDRWVGLILAGLRC